jgi:hypothetical protein
MLNTTYSKTIDKFVNQQLIPATIVSIIDCINNVENGAIFIA